jgi:type II secretory pathway component GspD/PulD (secretin)
MFSTKHALAAVVSVALLTPVFKPAPAFAQPTTTPTTTPAAPDPANDPLYSCKKRTGQITVTFKPETELKDLITWVMGFTCRNFLMDPRVVSTGKKVTVIAPLPMSQTEAYNLFLAALSTVEDSCGGPTVSRPHLPWVLLLA